MPSLWMKGRSSWTVLVAACWVEATSGLSYVFSTYSAVLKSELAYDQRHINGLAVAKDLGDHVGLVAGFLCRILPNWALLLLGAFLILGGYGSLWLLTQDLISALPFWLVCIIMFIGTNGSTYLDTAALVACLPNFPSSRATAVGLLKGFKGLSGAIFNQIYASFLAPDQTSFILFIAVAPAIVIAPLILMMGPGASPKPVPASDGIDLKFKFSLLYGASLLLAAYMLSVTLVQDLCDVSKIVDIIFTVVLFLILLLLPLVLLKISNAWFKNPPSREGSSRGDSRGLISDRFTEVPQASDLDIRFEENNGSSIEEQKLLGDAKGIPLLEQSDYTIWMAFRNANFWLLVFSVFFSMGSGTTAFNNLSQMAQAQGYQNTQVFVSMANIWDFLGRLAGGYASHVLTRSYGHPRAFVMAAAQVVMAIGHVLFATALPGTIHMAVFLVAAGYGAEWAVFPTTLSELFGLQNFGVLYNFVTIACPAGSLIYSTFIAGPVYDWQARKQGLLTCEGTVCFEVTFFVMAAVCMLATTLSIALSMRTRLLYSRC